MDSVRYRENSPTVVYEAFDDEVVAINLDTGCYFSLAGSAVAIWQHLQDGASAQEIAAALGRRYTGGDEIAPAVERFIGELQAEALLAPEPGAAGSGTTAASAVEGGEPFVAPVLEKYNDMQDLLLLDPIHDVGESGWPAQPAQAPPAGGA